MRIFTGHLIDAAGRSVTGRVEKVISLSAAKITSSQEQYTSKQGYLSLLGENAVNVDGIGFIGPDVNHTGSHPTGNVPNEAAPRSNTCSGPRGFPTLSGNLLVVAPGC
jgi:hypothetical protein